MNKVIKASGNSVEAYWPTLFAKALNTTNVGELLQNVITAGPAADPAAAAGAAAVVEEVKEENHKKEQVEADKAALEEDKKDAEKELKKMKFDAIQAVKQVVAKQEEEEGGIVDTITKVFATHAKVH